MNGYISGVLKTPCIVYVIHQLLVTKYHMNGKCLHQCKFGQMHTSVGQMHTTKFGQMQLPRMFVCLYVCLSGLYYSDGGIETAFIIEI